MVLSNSWIIFTVIYAVFYLILRSMRFADGVSDFDDIS